MTTVHGHYCDGSVPDIVPAQMDFADATATLIAGHTMERFDCKQLRISPRIGETQRFISVPNGGQFVCADLALLRALPQEGWSEGAVAWLEKRWWAALVGVMIIAALVLWGYFVGLPMAAERMAQRIPMETELALGSEVLVWLDGKNWLSPSLLEANTRDEIAQGFAQLIEGINYSDYYRLEFRHGEYFGPNAFAFPGAIIVVTDELVMLSHSTEEVLAVLAHEIGHVEQRHVTRGILQQSAVAIVVAAITSDAATLSAAVTSLPVVLTQLKYSRKMEAAADDFGFELLNRHGYSPEAFATMMERLSEDVVDKSRIQFLSTHPQTRDRTRRAREAVVE